MSIKEVKTPPDTTNKKKDIVKDLLDNVLDFGPDSHTESDTTERLKRLVKQLEDLNSRIQALKG